MDKYEIGKQLMLCEECVHYEICDEHKKLPPWLNADDCKKFKNKNQYIEIPCEIGRYLYKVVNDKRVKHPWKCKVVGVWYSADTNCNNIHLVRYVNNTFDSSFCVPFSEVGRTLFPTLEEAEQKLKERENNAIHNDR